MLFDDCCANCCRFSVDIKAICAWCSWHSVKFPSMRARTTMHPKNQNNSKINRKILTRWARISRFTMHLSEIGSSGLSNSILIVRCCRKPHVNRGNIQCAHPWNGLCMSVFVLSSLQNRTRQFAVHKFVNPFSNSELLPVCIYQIVGVRTRGRRRKLINENFNSMFLRQFILLFTARNSIYSIRMHNNSDLLLCYFILQLHTDT